ncbi:MAG TPA: LPP20 family lipoprotein [Candidatus Sumerlaeota bacterium]|nr:MAG: hypothetical protein BWY12_01414 [candidate division BRC1 bacterium ADurb.Bin183]HOE64727.1 LPP20 family lipoprotein [Candidatus Sumerlaeota bacterium]HRR30039.1 LPP20 family lipoprotein [Candidatus Sumerlaeia bacterium]HON51237.1 LPP20 family lipoprotein [Candidatus Sumerlaeota bacterium]HOR64446.1 LPP20 family lipoprotein [Candidatus Sumerlaeota bacterium]
MTTQIKKFAVWMAIFVLFAAMATAQTVVSSPQQAKLMAKKAAISDAQRSLAETVYGVRLDSRTTVRNFVTENDEIHTNVEAILRGAQVVDTRWDPDGVCTVRMELPVAALQRALHRSFAYHSDVITAEGHGVPNPVGGEPPIIRDTPAPEESWYHLVIKATGSGVAPEDMVDTAQGKVMAERAAHLDALRQLGENIKGVKVTANTTVRNFVTENDEIKTRFNAFLRGARRVETRHLEDGICEVDVEISLEGMRSFIPAGARIEKGGPRGQRPGAQIRNQAAPQAPTARPTEGTGLAGPYIENLPQEERANYFREQPYDEGPAPSPGLEPEE